MPRGLKEKMNEEETIKRFEAIEKRLNALEGKTEKRDRIKKESKTWYKKGGTVDKVVSLIPEEFFDKAKTIKEIVGELKTKDYHLKASDLTLPLRNIVRKNILRKTKKLDNGSESKKWLYIKA